MEEVRVMREINGKELSVNDLVIPLSFGARITNKDNLFGLVISRDKIWCNYNGDFKLKTCELCLKVEEGELGEIAKKQYELLSSTYMDKMNKKLSFIKVKSSDLKPGQVFKVMPSSSNSAWYSYIYIGSYDLSMSGSAEVNNYSYGLTSKKKIVDYNNSVSRKYLFLRYMSYSLNDLDTFLNKLSYYQSNLIDMKTLMCLGEAYSKDFYNGLEPVDKLPSNLEYLFDIQIDELLNSIDGFLISLSYNYNNSPHVYIRNSYSYGTHYLNNVDIKFTKR